MTVGDVLKYLMDRPDDEPFVLALGKGRILAPVALRQVRAQALPPAGYYVVHTDLSEPGGLVTVCVEAPRIEPGPQVTS